MNYSNVKADEIIIGKNVIIEPTAIIRGLSGKAKKIFIGDNTYIGHNVQIICDHFEIGDYCKMHHHTNVHGYLPCKIGHNAWIGQYTIIDSIGGTKIGNNCGIGAHSQLWSHIKFGDMLEGCRFLDERPLAIGNDVWFVGHCIVSPIIAADKSMAMVGSVVTKDMAFNTVYAGTPAKPISDKIGPQFKEVSEDEKFNYFNEVIKGYKGSLKSIKVVKHINEIDFNDNLSYFCTSTRTYKKLNTEEEIDFMKYLLPEKGKFVPHNL
jgi:acetyltransferase-like isoleucine patch superfamily enzyme